MSKQIGHLIRDLRKQKGLTQRQFAEQVGMNHTYLSKIENGRVDTTPSVHTLVAMADVLSIDRDWLLTQCGRPPERIPESIAENPEFFQRLGKLSGQQLDGLLQRQPYALCTVESWGSHNGGGGGTPASRGRNEYSLVGQVPAGTPLEAIEDTESFELTDLFAPGEHFLLRVRGSSMIDDGIFDGDIAIISPQQNCENGEIVVALIDGQEATLKRFYRQAGQIRLQPANASMEPILVGPDRIELRGKVVGIIRPRM